MTKHYEGLDYCVRVPLKNHIIWDAESRVEEIKSIREETKSLKLTKQYESLYNSFFLATSGNSNCKS